VRFDHALEDVLDRDALALARQVVRDGEDRPEIVGRVAPWKKKKKGNDDVILLFYFILALRLREGVHVTFCGEEAVVVVEPADDGADVERSADRVELVVGP
jgi:hypothetical protein